MQIGRFSTHGNGSVGPGVIQERLVYWVCSAWMVLDATVYDDLNLERAVAGTFGLGRRGTHAVA